MNGQLLRRGLTLIELLVVIGIIAILLGISAAAVQRAREAASQTTCRNNLRQIALALHQFNNVHGSLPQGCSYQGGRDPFPHVSWCTRLSPFLEQEASWLIAQQAFAQERFFLRRPHWPVLGAVMRVFLCPSDGRIQEPRDNGLYKIAFTSYLGLEGTNQSTRDGLLFLDSHVRLSEVWDGMSNTLMVGERPPSADLVFGWRYAGWGQAKDGSGEMILGVREVNVFSEWVRDCPAGPYEFGPGQVNNQCDLFHYWSLHPGGAHFVFADGSVRFLRYSANPLMTALATRAGGETVTLPD